MMTLGWGQRVKSCKYTGLSWCWQRCRLGRDDRIIVVVSDEFGHLLVLIHDIELYALFVVRVNFVVIRVACCAEHDTLRPDFES